MVSDGTRRFLNDFSFWKWVISLALAVAINTFYIGAKFTQIEAHLTDSRIHLTEADDELLYGIKNNGFTQPEKVELITRLKTVENEILHIKEKMTAWDPASVQVATIKEAITQVLREDGYTLKKGK